QRRVVCGSDCSAVSCVAVTATVLWVATTAASIMLLWARESVVTPQIFAFLCMAARLRCCVWQQRAFALLCMAAAALLCMVAASRAPACGSRSVGVRVV